MGRDGQGERNSGPTDRTEIRGTGKKTGTDWTNTGTQIGVNGQEAREQGQMDKEEETREASRGAEIKDAEQRDGQTKRQRLGVPRQRDRSRRGQTRGQPFLIHAFNDYSLSTNYMPGTGPDAAEPAENGPYTVPDFLVLQSSERETRGKQVNKHT